MVVQHNIMALNAYNRLSNNNSMVSKNLEKLSSGYRINRAGDDAAGLAISEKMRAQITGLERASDNAQDGISLVQTAEGALTEVHSMLNRMVELATQSANGTFDNEVDRANLQKEVDSLKSEINRIAESTNFNGINLLDGSLGAAASVTTTTGGAATITRDDAVTDVTGLDASNATIKSDATGLTYSVADKSAAAASGSTAVIGVGAAGEGLSFDIDLGVDGSELNGVKINISIGASAVTGNTAAFDADNNTINIILAGDDLTGDYGGTTTDAGTGIATAAQTALRTLTDVKGVDLSSATVDAGAANANVAITAGLNLGTATMAGGAVAGKTVTVSDGTTSWTKDISSAEHTAGGTFELAATGKGTVSITLGAGAADATDDALATVDAGTPGTTTLDFTGKIGQDVIGSSIQIGGNTYEFVKAGESAAAGNTAISLSEDATDAQIADAVNTALAGGTVTAGLDPDVNTKVVLTSADKDPVEVKQTGKGLGLQIGDTADQKISVKVSNMDSDSLGLDNVNISSESRATASIQYIKTAINTVSSTRADLGAIQNRLEHTVNNLATTTENLTSAESRIRDTDMASEMMAYTKNNVLSQAAQAMLAQANQQPQQILQLLQ